VDRCYPRIAPAQEGLFEGIAIVTGAGSGIGRAIVLELARWGVPCCLVGRTLSKLQEVARLTDELGVESIPIAADLGDLGAIVSLAQQIRSFGRRVVLLVHSAALMRFSRVEHSTVEDFTTMFEVNVLAPFALTKLLLPEICAARGQIVFINSSVVNHPAAGTAEYAATKHALKGLADGLRQEVNAAGVRVLSVYPGRTATPLQESVCEMEGRAYLPEALLQPEDVAATVVCALALPPSAEVTDILMRPASKPK
jgi:NADP-dependent 3-hydroxy acid dehydrogenase YdfG